MDIYLNKLDSYDQNKAKEYISKIENTKLRSIVESIEICFDPDDLNTLIKTDQDIISQYQEFSEVLNQCLEEPGESDDNKSNWIIRIEMNRVEMLDKNISMDDINFALTYAYGNTINCVYSDYNADDLIFRIRLKNIMNNSKKKPNQVH